MVVTEERAPHDGVRRVARAHDQGPVDGRILPGEREEIEPIERGPVFERGTDACQ